MAAPTMTVPDRRTDRALHPVAQPVRPGRSLPVLAVVAVATAAALGFALQPLAARLTLPHLGGSAAVWSTSLVFFQLTLLAGYLLAHLLITRCRIRTQMVVVGILAAGAAALALPIQLPGWWLPSVTQPVGSVLLVLLASAGPVFVVTSMMSPLLSHWFAATGHPSAHNPYVLYAASNLGSILGLVAYPFLVEPTLGLQAQGRWWAAGFALTVVAGCALGVQAGRSEAMDPARPDELAPTRPGWRTRLVWIGLAALPSALLVGTTQLLSTDLAAVPLLWMVPLTLYLLSFVLAFAPGGPRGAAASGILLPIAVLVVALGYTGALTLPLLGEATAHLTVLFTAAVVAHTQLVRRRPPPALLSTFYLWLALGGALGSTVVTLVAPLVFSQVLEHPIAVGLSLLALPAGGALGRLWAGALASGVLIAVLVVAPDVVATDLPIAFGVAGAAALVGTVVLLRHHPIALAISLGVALVYNGLAAPLVLLQERTFFGVHQVYAEAGYHVLAHGTTVHGYQSLDPNFAGLPLSYFHPDGPLGEALATGIADAADIAVVGLGAGSIAAYGHAGQSMTFFEIDPAVARIAQDARWFTFLANSQADVEVRLVDGRLGLASGPDASVDLIVLDAFSSDSIPVHLLTVEAMTAYRRLLRPDGRLLVHVTNRHLALAPVVAAAGAEAGLHAVESDDPGALDDGRERSHWVALAADPDTLDPLGWQSVPDASSTAWTDDRSDLLGAFTKGLGE